MAWLKSQLRNWNRWKRFCRTERDLVLCAMLLLPLVSAMLRVMGLRRTQWVLLQVCPKRTIVNSQETLSDAHQIASCVEKASRFCAWQTSCLQTSVALWYLMRSRGIAGELRIGVSTAQFKFRAHSWVEHRGVVLGDKYELQRSYASFAHRFGSRS